ncbi:MAG TPA: hypothetical protein VGC13_30015 [Longimicrobium sp.]|uniref:hypothetical protein n=1 Tax=Longimicrobium sp. TaxID=2029185 RepID=UPI002EDAD88D
MDELQIVAIALGELTDLVANDEAHLVLTESLRDLVEALDWSEPRPYALLTEIYRLLTLLFLQPRPGLIDVDVSSAEGTQSHPIPIGCHDTGLVEYWAEEMGKLLVLHDSAVTDDGFFIGIACPFAFAGETRTRYPEDSPRAFPLVGLADLPSLEDAYQWDVPANVLRQRVSFRQAFANCHAIGAQAVESPPGGSHYKVIFPGKRPWPLDKNVDPIADRFLDQLTDITGFSKGAVRFALTQGQLPPKKLRLPQHETGR